MQKTKHEIQGMYFDYDPSCSLEVYHQQKDRWIRVTWSMFRSWDGKRRVLKKDYKKGRVGIAAGYADYEGPLYLFQTNTEVDPKGIDNLRWPEDCSDLDIKPNTEYDKNRKKKRRKH
tara:strand:+ start:1739 stop:2089 length:351 start_codon:yes stop_codon:yes gene_type:complete